MQKDILGKLFNKENVKIFLMASAENGCAQIKKHPKISVAIIAGIVVCSALSLVVLSKPMADLVADGNDSIAFSIFPMAATSSQKSVITVPSGVVKANPFVPYRQLEKQNAGTDVPEFSLIEPPEVVNENSDAARVMDTIVSGILYDKYSPSAILNIEGNDYLVKKGDVVNNYKVINITQNSVTVKLGSNVYKAGIGEILTEGTLTHNEVSNLSNKFGGEK